MDFWFVATAIEIVINNTKEVSHNSAFVTIDWVSCLDLLNLDFWFL